MAASRMDAGAGLKCSGDIKFSAADSRDRVIDQR